MLFLPQDDFLRPLVCALDSSSRPVVTLWALDRAAALAPLPDAGQAFEVCMAWAYGRATMREARPYILALHRIARALDDPVACALYHALAQGLSTIHSPRHAIGLPVYELTAIVRRDGVDAGLERCSAMLDEYVDTLVTAAGRWRRGDIRLASFITVGV